MRSSDLSASKNSSPASKTESLTGKSETLPRGPKFLSSRKSSRSCWLLIKTTVMNFINDQASVLAAAIAYYAVFSLAPLLLIAIAIAGFFYGSDEHAQSTLTRQFEGVLGTDGTNAILGMLRGANRAGGGAMATIFGIGALLYGASGVFAQLKSALNIIWEVKEGQSRGILGTVIDRLLSAVLVVFLGVLLLASMFVTAVVASVSQYLQEYLSISGSSLHLLNLSVTGMLVTTIFAAMFKFLPDQHIHWKDVFIGAIFTALLFMAGNYGLGIYISKAAIGSTYGSAGSVLIVLLWANYSAMIVLLGAEFTQAYTLMYGSQSSGRQDNDKPEVVLANN